MGTVLREVRVMPWRGLRLVCGRLCPLEKAPRLELVGVPAFEGKADPRVQIMVFIFQQPSHREFPSEAFLSPSL